MLSFDADTHTYWLGDAKVPSVTTILKAVSDLDAIPPAILAHAAERGTAVHLGCELYDNDDLDWDSVSEELVPYIEAWVDFRATTGFKPILVESRVFHSGLFYAGTLDRTGVLYGDLAVVDIKTTATMYPWVGMQLAAYQEALHVSMPDEPKHTKRYAVQLKDDGRWKLHEYKEPTDWPTFVALRTLVNWSNKHKTRISYEPD